MPFIDSKVTVKISDTQEKELKTRLGKAISLLPGKSERWLMAGFEDEYSLYFAGDNSSPSAFIDVSVFGGPDSAGFAKLTSEITKIFNEVLNIPADRIYIKYSATRDWGWNGKNF